MKNIPSQPLAGCKAHIDYPCVWQYKVIGMDKQAVQTAVSAHLGDAPYSLSDSHRSVAGKYLSMNLEVTVESDEQRLELYHALAGYPAVKVVL
jgi:putative lipoic acid-binding regulatory protein